MDGLSNQARPAPCAIIALMLWCCALGGCASWNSGIDPSGERIFLPPESSVASQSNLLPGIVVSQEQVVVTPRQVIAPVGSEVVMLAGICGGDGFLNAGERIEWMISPDSVGEIVTVGGRGDVFSWRAPTNVPRKVDNHYAIGSTNYRATNITRGTPDPADDINVQAGQAWAAITSPTEGSTEITAFAPSVTGWAYRKTTATVHWIDAQWVFPPPAVNPVGQPHVFTTTITRNSSGAPLAGWIVRYEILDGPAAGFAPDGAQVIEVPTDELGQSSVEIAQSAPQAGTARVSVQVIRPPLLGSTRAGRLVLGTGLTTKTWSAPDLAITMAGPASGGTDGVLVYRAEVSNPGDLPTRDVSVSAELPPGLTLVEAVPAGDAATGSPTWNLGTLGPGQVRSIELRCRPEREGTYNVCAIARTSEGLSARDCAATTVTTVQPAPITPPAGPGKTPAPLPTQPTTPAEPRAAAVLVLQVAGPPTATVGDTARYQVTVSNRGNAVATGLVISDRFGDGFEHMVAASPIERDLDDLPPGQSRTIYITFRIAKPGTHCHDVEITGNGGLRVAKRACLEAAARPAAQPQPPVEPQGQPAMEVKKTGPRTAEVGETVEFLIVVRNTGDVPLTNLRIADRYQLPLDPVDASEGFVVGRDELVWTVPRLAPGKEHRLQVNCECAAAARNACNAVTVTSDEVGPIGDEACLAIVGRQAPPVEPDPQPQGRPELDVSIASLDEPARMGAAARYRVFVRNNGDASAKSVRLTVTFPNLLKPTVIGTRAMVRAAVEGQTIRFEPVAELRAGEPLTFEVRGEAVSAGQAQVSAQVTSETITTPVSAQRPVEVLRQP